MMDHREKMDRQFEFCREIDKEKFIGRQTYLTDGVRKENDAEHAWHMAVMALILSEYSNEKLDLLKTIAMILMHDVVEVDAGDTYAYDEEGKKTQAERELKAAERLYGLLPEKQAEKFKNLWLEFEEQKTPEAKFARTMDNIQPLMLNAASNGKAWEEHGVHLSQILKRNEKTMEGSEKLWEYAKENFIDPNIKNGKIDTSKHEKT
ncbi:MAG: HD domain-containing protein [Lachnospiraceae bacterium]|nr:HD domain-containing protein [Lachnospiraceae bacterium]